LARKPHARKLGPEGDLERRPHSIT
jgi:hypothetical protein